jgi:2-polyprenyl-3-methyl-5-hydroxy-6-metoxy-1,4-benzoquinol methylase
MDSMRTALTYRALRRTGRPTSVFEIGFGSGALLRRFHEDGATIAGVDPDQLGVGLDEVVRRHATLWHGTMEDVPDGAVAADLVVGVHVIEHVADPMSTVRKAVSLLTGRGRLVLLTPAGDSWGLSTFGSAWWMLEDPTHVRFFTKDSLSRLARQAGLTNIRVERLVVDSISVDLASVVRAVRPPGPAGALASRPVRLAALASSPVVGGMRVMAPRTRATLCLTADRGPR